jgi:hypothetical protein
MKAEENLIIKIDHRTWSHTHLHVLHLDLPELE